MTLMILYHLSWNVIRLNSREPFMKLHTCMYCIIVYCHRYLHVACIGTYAYIVNLTNKSIQDKGNNVVTRNILSKLETQEQDNFLSNFAN